jgi:REP-associated tyrosine transposase
MAYDARRHHRRSIRLRGHDYAGGGAYFVTVCTQAKKCLFGEIVEGNMILNEAGTFVQRIWCAMPQRFGSLVLDAFQVMPNHLHGIFVLPGPGLEPALAVATGAPIIQPTAANFVGRSHGNERTASRPPTEGRVPIRTSVGDVVGAFKSISTIAVNKLMSRPGARPLHENFYEHIIRDTHELKMIRDYIVHNPQRWRQDPENPNVT